MRLPAHQPAAQACVLGAKQSIQMGFAARGTQAPGNGNHHQRVMDGDQNRDFVSRKRLGGVLTAAGAGTCPGRAPFCWNRASEESRHLFAILSAKVGGGAVTAASGCPHHSPLIALNSRILSALSKFLAAQPLTLYVGFPLRVWEFPAFLGIRASAFNFISPVKALFLELN